VTTFVIGAPLSFSAPTVEGVVNDVLDPFAQPLAVRVFPPLGELLGTDTYVVRTTDATGNELYRSAVTPGSTSSVTMPAQAFTRSLGGVCKVNYEVTRDSRTYLSADRTLTIPAIPDNEPRLPHILVAEAGTPQQVLDLSSFQGDATYVVTRWVWMHAGQRYWITCRNTAAAPIQPRPDLPVADGVEVRANEVTPGLLGNIDRTWLDTLEEGSLLHVDLAVTFDGSTTRDAAVAFPTKTLTIVKQAPLKRPIIEEAVGDDLDPSSFTDAAHIKTEPDSRVTTGLYYWATVVSTAGGTDISYPVASGERVTAGDAANGIRIPIGRDILDILPGGSTLTVRVSINLEGNDDPFDAVPYPERTYNVRRPYWTVEWDLEDAGSPAPVKAPGRLELRYMDITFAVAHVRPSENTVGIENFNYSMPDYFGGKVLYIGAPPDVPNDNLVHIIFRLSWKEVRFAMTSVYQPVEVTWLTWLDHTYQPIGSPQIVPGGDATKGYDVRSPLLGPLVKGVTIRSKDVIRLDYFKFRG